MNTLEEAGQPFGNKQHFREASYNDLEASYNDLPPEVKNLVDKALDSMEMGIFPGNVQMYALETLSHRNNPCKQEIIPATRASITRTFRMIHLILQPVLCGLGKCRNWLSAEGR